MFFLVYIYIYMYTYLEPETSIYKKWFKLDGSKSWKMVVEPNVHFKLVV